MGEPLKVCYAASEIAPFAKTGGLADVSAALPRALHQQGHDVRPFFPRYLGREGEPSLTPVEFCRDIPVQLGPHGYTFSVLTGRLPGSDLPLYFIDCPALYGRDSIYTSDPDEAQRFALFSRAVFESCQRMSFGPDVLHCNDWHTGLMPVMLRTLYEWDGLFSRTAALLSIHNLGYQGFFPAETIEQVGLGPFSHLFDQDELHAGRISFLRTGLLYADVLGTVSPTYAREIQTPEFGNGLDRLLHTRRDRLIGILNGVDYDEWSPENDSFIPHRYSSKRVEGKAKNKRYLQEQLKMPAAPDAPLLGIVSRLTRQKGLDLCADVLPDALAGTDLRIAVLGTGEARYEQMFETLQQRFPGRIVFYRGYSNELAHLIEAGADMLLMASQYEPCGLNQLYSLRYGTVPIVRRTGGLADSVQSFDERTGQGTGVVFDHFDARGLTWALSYALKLYRNRPAWLQLVRNGMAADFSWERQARQYVALYSRMAGR